MSKDADVNVPASYATTAALFADYLKRIHDAATCFAGSSGLPGTPTVLDVGAMQLVTSTPAQPYLQQYVQLTAGPTYGLRVLRLVKKLRPADVVSVVASATRSTDLAYAAAVSLAASLDSSVQDAGAVAFLVASVKLRVRVRITTGAHPGGDKCYVALKSSDDTMERKVYAPAVAGVWTEDEVTVHLRSTEGYKIAIDTNGGTNPIEYQIDLMEAEEVV